MLSYLGIIPSLDDKKMASYIFEIANGLGEDKRPAEHKSRASHNDLWPTMSLSAGMPHTRAVLSPSARVSIPRFLPWFFTAVSLLLVPFIVWDLFSKHFQTALAQVKLSSWETQNLGGAIPILYAYFVLIEFLYCNPLHFDARESTHDHNQWPYSRAGALSPDFSPSIKLDGLNRAHIIDHIY